MNDRLVAVILLVGIALAVLYGLLTAMAVVRVSRLPKWQRAPGASPNDASADIPRFVSRGEPFEESWQGSAGYARPEVPAENWADRLIVSVITPLRPSRFNDRSYWRSALPFVVVTRLVLFVGLPVFAILLIPTPPASPGVSFTPTPSQRTAILDGSTEGTLGTCPRGTGTPTGTSSVTDVSPNKDGAIYSVHAGTAVVVTYYAGFSPSFSPQIPLCRVDLNTSAATHEIDYEATRIGTGFVYFPEPGGRAYVGEVDVVAPYHPSVPTAIVVIALLVVFADIVLQIRLRQLQRQPRWTPAARPPV